MNEKDVNAVKSYFNKDVSETISAMTMSEMKDLLKELEGTKFWFAIIKYNQERLGNAQNALITLDPFKEPTSMARYQGVMSGILDLQDAVITMKSESKKSENPNKKSEDAKNELGGAYGLV